MKKIVLAGAAGVLLSPAAFAVEIKAGDWNVNVGGIVNAYYTHVSCSGDAVGGLALASVGIGCGGEDSRTTIGNGLLPNGLVTSATTRQAGFDIKAHIGIYHATATDSAIAQNSEVDVRQAYFSFGSAELGTFKLGRDNGIFGANAIFGDMTLIGAGAPVQATQRGRVTLGHIGAGYAYVGYYGQMAYSSPRLSGFGIDAGVFNPVTDSPIVAAAQYSSRSNPQVQAQLSFADGPFKAWLGAKSQKFKAVAPGAGDFTMSGWEAGASLQQGAFGLLANYQGGKGLGVLSDADQGKVKSRHWLLQGTVKASEKLKLGLGYGISRNEDNTAGTHGLKSNANLTAGAYYALTGAITLVGEAGQTRSKSFAGGEAKMNGAAFGGILFF
jgi:predicted porin